MAEAPQHYLDELNEAQREAVMYCDGPSLVIAGAGSGKTRVLTYKIAYLLEHGYEPWSILALTFTNKAADEMKSRIARQVGEEKARRLWMGTFHSIFARILRAESDTIGFSSNFTIYDAADSKSLVRDIIREMQLDEKQYKASRIISHISAAKNRLLTPDSYMRDASIQRADVNANIGATGQIYQRYWARCRQADAMDFDDILLYTYLLFYYKPEIRERYEQRFRFVLVDEYQDTNYAQHAIVWQLSEHTRRVCVVGDDAQSIYSFRGANIDNILTFQQLYQGARLFKLEQNYRSTQNIVSAANSLIHKNRGQIHKNVFSKGAEGQKLHAYQYASDIEEANGVARKVLSLKQYDHITWSDMAVLYRTNAQSRSFEEAFRKHDIPYRVYGGTSFYQRKEIKDLIAYFRLVVNPNDEEALKRIINYPARGIGQTTLAKVIDAAQQQNVSLWHVLNHPLECNLSVSPATLTKLMAFVQLIDSFIQLMPGMDAAQIGQQIATRSGIVAEIYRSKEPEDLSRQENVQELLDGMKQFVADRLEEEGSGSVLLTNYLQEISLVSDIDETGEDDSEEKLSLMTVHSAKGLEFRVVFIVGMEEDLFPNQMASSSQRELEEERRLFYVAITRAKEQCFITYAQNRYRFGKLEFGRPSSFLDDIDSAFIQFDSSFGSSFGRSSRRSYYSDDVFGSDQSSGLYRRQNTFGSSRQEPSSPFVTSRRVDASDANTSRPLPQRLRRIVPSAPESSSTQPPAGGDSALSIGDCILHERFGRGRVISLSGSGLDAKATIEFENVGTKQLLLRFAKFKRIEN